MADKRVNNILKEVDQEYTISSHLEKYIRRGIVRALRKIDIQNELFSDIMLKQRETM